MDSNVLGTQISSLRNKYGMTQEELALKIDVSKQTISNWETGLKTPRMGAIQKLSDLFNVSKSFIIEGSDDLSDEFSIVYNQLNSKNKREVIEFAKFKLKEQNKVVPFKKPESIDNKDKNLEVLAAHIDENTTEEEMDEITAFIDSLRDE